MKIEPTQLIGGNPVMHRLQIGVSGVAAVLLMVGLADMMQEGASNETPLDASATVEPGQLPEGQVDPATGTVASNPTEPLADLGVVPDLPAENAPQDPAVAPPKPGQVVPDLASNPDLKRGERQ